MMNWLYYLLEANLYLAIFYGFYRLFLHNETFYELNRYYLITITLVSFILPVLQIGYLNQLLSIYSNQNLVYTDPKLTDIKVNNASMFNTDQFITGAYMIITAVFLVKFICSLYRILWLAIKAKKQKHGNVIFIELNSSDTAFSFFNLLFINPIIDKKNTILKHEMVHIKQKHSIDILFFELVRILNWFNPVTLLIKKDIKLLHEYIADHITTESDVPKHDYAMFLIQNSFGNIPSQLTNQIFNQSILKRRISMLNKKKSAGRARLRLLYLLPVTGIMLCVSTMAFTKDYAVIDLYTPKNQPQTSIVVQQPTQQKKKYFYIKETEKRLLVLNGKALNKKGEVTIEGFDRMVELKGKAAVDKYGNSATNGAIEFTGVNLKTSIKFPPPIVTKDVALTPPAAKVKFPPPAKVKFPPPVKVKFPPPIVTKDVPSPKPSTEVRFPPPPPPPVPPKTKATDAQENVIEVKDGPDQIRIDNNASEQKKEEVNETNKNNNLVTITGTRVIDETSQNANQVNKVSLKTLEGKTTKQKE